MPQFPSQRLPRISAISPIGGERSNASDVHRSPPPDYRHSRATECARLRVVTNSSDSWRSHVHRTYTAQRVQPFKPHSANANFLWVGLREGYLFSKKRYPSLVRAAPASAASPPLLPRGEQTKRKPSQASFSQLRSLHRDRLRKIARFIDIAPALERDIVCQ